MKIFIENLIFNGTHGLTQKELRQPQRFCVDLCLDCRIADKAENGIGSTIDYRVIKNIAREVIEGPHCDLVETLGFAIADRIMAGDKKTRAVSVRVRKLDIWDNGVPGIEITRKKRIISSF